MTNKLLYCIIIIQYVSKEVNEKVKKNKRETKIVPIIFSIEQYNWLKKKSQYTYQSMSALIRNLLNEKISEEKFLNKGEIKNES